MSPLSVTFEHTAEDSDSTRLPGGVVRPVAAVYTGQDQSRDREFKTLASRVRASRGWEVTEGLPGGEVRAALERARGSGGNHQCVRRKTPDIRGFDPSQ